MGSGKGWLTEDDGIFNVWDLAEGPWRRVTDQPWRTEIHRPTCSLACLACLCSFRWSSMQMSFSMVASASTAAVLPELSTDSWVRKCRLEPTSQQQWSCHSELPSPAAAPRSTRHTWWRGERLQGLLWTLHAPTWPPPSSTPLSMLDSAPISCSRLRRYGPPCSLDNLEKQPAPSGHWMSCTGSCLGLPFLGWKHERCTGGACGTQSPASLAMMQQQALTARAVCADVRGWRPSELGLQEQGPRQGCSRGQLGPHHPLGCSG